MSKILGGVLAIGVMLTAVGAEHAPPLVRCDVKGNISHDTGERIFHSLGQQSYAATRINMLDGERWFCSKQAARDAAWRKALR